MSQGKTMKGATVKAPTIATATLPFGLGYRPTDEDLLEMELKKTACAKAKAKGFPSPLEPFKAIHSYTKWEVYQSWRLLALLGFPKPRNDLELKKMLPGVELFLDYNTQLLKEMERNTNWVRIDWANYMDPNVMTTLLGNAIFNLEEEEYWEAYQHALNDPSE